MGMRNLAALRLGTFVVGSASRANAELFNIYAQGHGGVSGNDSAPGPTLGVEVGAKVLLLTGYFNVDDYVSHGTVKRAILGLGTDVGLLGWRLSGRAGAGLMFENDGVFGMMDPVGDRSGFVARAGAALDHQLATAVWIGIGLDAEYFAIKATSDSALDKDVHTGGDILGSLHLRFELGI